MKHLHLASGLLIGVVLAGCGDYGDDGAVYSTGSDTAELGSTDFNLAVAAPQFGAVSGKLQRGGRALPRAVTGSTPVTDLTPDDVRAYVIVPDDSSIAGYREVPIEVAEFEALGNGRYRIAIDGQAQVDGFFAVTIDGVIFRVPLSRTGTTDEPIDVNALQAALADRLQALLVADQVCATLTLDALNTIIDDGEAYIASLSVPDDINDLEALVDFYRVAAASFMQSAITQACAPPLDDLASAAVPGNYHALSAGAAASVDDLSTLAATYLSGFATQAMIGRTLDETDTTQVLQQEAIERDDRYVVAHAPGSNGGSGVLSDLSTQFPDVIAPQATASLVAFANDAGRAALQFAEAIDVEPNTGARGFAPGFVIAKTPARQLLPQNGSLFGATQTTRSLVDLSGASTTCLASIGMTSAQLADSEAFAPAAQAAIDVVGDAAFAARLQADCGGATTIALDTSLQVQTQAIAPSTPLALADLAGRYALVGLQWTQQLSAAAGASGYEGSSSDLLLDIDVEGGMTPLAKSQARVFQPVSAGLGGVASTAVDADTYALQLPVDQSENPVTDGHIRLNTTAPGGAFASYSGFVSAAPHNLMALNLSSLSDVGGAVGGFTLVDTLVAAQGTGIATSADLALVHGSSVGIAAVDISNPQDLQLISTLTGIGEPLDVAIDANAQYAFVAAGSLGLQVVDITDPAAMTLEGNGLGSPSISYASRIALVPDAQGDAELALVADGTRLHAIDVRDPAAPALLASYDIGNDGINSLALVGDAVLVGSYLQLVVLDLAQFLDGDGQTNSFVAIPNTLQINNTVGAIEVVGTTAYLAISYDRIYAYDVSDVASIGLLGSVAIEHYASNISVAGNRLYTSLSNEGYSATAVIDITDPANLQEVDRLPLSGDSAVVGGHLVVASGDDRVGLVTVDAATPGPQVVASVGSFGADPLVAIAGTTLWQVNANDGLSSYDITDPLDPQLLDTLDVSALGGSPIDIEVVGNYAYISTSAPSLVIVDIADPANLAVVGSPFTLSDYPGALAPFGQGASRYIAVGAGFGVDLINVTTPATPTLVQSVPINDTTYDLAVSPDGLTAYVAGNSGIHVIDLTSIGNATFSTFTDVSNVRGVITDGSYIYAATRFDGLHVIDATSLTVVGSYYDLQDFNAIELQGSTAYLLGDESISVVDVSNVAAMRALGAVALPSFSGTLAVTGQYIFATSYDVTQQLPYGIDIYLAATTQRATSAIAVGVRLPSTTLTAADLAGRKFALAGQQTGQSNIPSPSRHAAFGALAGGSLRFVSVGGEVYPVFDLPLAGMVVSDFSGVLPRLEIRFEQWQPGAVTVDGNGRWSFTLTQGGSGETATFAGYVGADGLLVGHGTLFTGDAPVIDGDDTVYSSLTAASQLMMVGVPL